MPDELHDHDLKIGEALDGADYVASSMGCVVLFTSGLIVALCGVIAWLLWNRK